MQTHPKQMHTISSKFFIKVQGDFAVRARTQSMPAGLKRPLQSLVVVEFTVDHNMGKPVLIRDRLATGFEVNNAEACMPEACPAVFREPDMPFVGTPVAHRP